MTTEKEAEQIVEQAITLVEGLMDDGLLPGDVLKVMTTAIVLVIRNAEFKTPKPEIAKDITTLITSTAAKAARNQRGMTQ